MYESELTRFLRELREKNPNLAELQRKNRATWWDKRQDLEIQKERRESSVAQPGYVYFPLPRPEKDDDQDSAKRLSTPSRPA
jgi:hypothetical protein